MLKIGSLHIERPLLLAPMDDVTDRSFRIICKEMGADIVVTEFVNCEGLIRGNKKTAEKLKIRDDERPAGIQLYGNNLDSMVEAARVAADQKPEFIDINAGCWVKKIANRGAGAGLLKDPPFLQKLVKAIVDAVDIPVTVKTRLGWDSESIYITEVAQRLEDAGIAALTIHCRTRAQAHKGDADWSWIDKVKDKVDYPVILNGNVKSGADAVKAFKTTRADGVMIGTGAIGAPWIFREAKELIMFGKPVTDINEKIRISTCLKHLKLACEGKGERKAVLEHRKYYTGYLKGYRNASKIRASLMKPETFSEVEEILNTYLLDLSQWKSEGIAINTIENEIADSNQQWSCKA